MKRAAAALVAGGIALFAAAAPTVADHGLAPVTAETRCEMRLSTDGDGNVVVTGKLVDPPSTFVVLQFSSQVEPLNFESWHRGTHARIDIGFSTPPEIGETSSPVIFGSGGVIGGYDFRFLFESSGVKALAVTGSMEAGPECHAALLPDTSTDRPLPAPQQPSWIMWLVAVAVGAMAWWFRRFVVPDGHA